MFWGPWSSRVNGKGGANKTRKKFDDIHFKEIQKLTLSQPVYLPVRIDRFTCVFSGTLANTRFIRPCVRTPINYTQRTHRWSSSRPLPRVHNSQLGARLSQSVSVGHVAFRSRLWIAVIAIRPRHVIGGTLPVFFFFKLFFRLLLFSFLFGVNLFCD